MRDYTMNSLLYDPSSGKVLDFVGGVQDLKSRVLRMNRPPPVQATNVLQEVRGRVGGWRGRAQPRPPYLSVIVGFLLTALIESWGSVQCTWIHPKPLTLNSRQCL